MYTASTFVKMFMQFIVGVVQIVYMLYNIWHTN